MPMSVDKPYEQARCPGPEQPGPNDAAVRMFVALSCSLRRHSLWLLA